MQRFRHLLRRTINSFAQQDRDPRYIVCLLWAGPLFVVTYLQAVNAGWFDSLEKPIFTFINDFPSAIGTVMYVITQLGSLGGLLIWMGIAWYLINRRAAYTVAFAGVAGWLLAKVAKTGVHRGRPEEFFHKINLFHDQVYGGFGFPSGHSTLVAACVTVLYYQVQPRLRKWLLLAAFLVGVSRIYLGAHFPLDVVGGWALGVIAGSLTVLLWGTSTRLLSVHAVKRALKRKNYDVTSARFARVDARGSRPVFIELADGRTLFGKLFGDQEHAADWLFKLYRFFRYKNLDAEEPYLNGRRNIELESFANLWGQKAGVRTPEVVDIIKVGKHWLLLQDRLDAKQLTDFKRLKTATLEDAWRQVKKMHAGNLAHRDLRAANLMVDTHGKVWLIDFGFAETAPSKARRSMDIAELLMSMSLVAGVERTVMAAKRVLGVDALRSTVPYVHRSVFSGATNHELRKNKAVLGELQSTLKDHLRIEGEVEEINIDRINARKILLFGALALFIYVILPQLSTFTDALAELKEINVKWLPWLVLFSIATYVAAGAVFVALASVPLKLREATIVQLAASFMSKIIPGGLGSSGVNARYLVKSGLDAAEASALLVGQNAVGFVTFFVPLLLILPLSGQNIGSLFHVHVEFRWVLVGAVLLAIAGIVLLLSRKIRARVFEGLRTVTTQLRDLSTSPRELALAAGASLLISICYVACLYVAINAVNESIGIISVLVVYASAIIAKSAIPAPGGLGPVEVAMSAALIGTGMAAGTAFAAVILYRLATFWLPIPFSVLAYRYAMARKLI